MTPDDPRHGTNAGYRAGCHCAPCRAGANGYDKRYRWDRHNGVVRTVPSVGTRRRVHALNALGWDNITIARHAGRSKGWVTEILKQESIYASTAALICRVYDELSMRIPEPSPAATRARNTARKNRWQPPLAWDDDRIDDPAYRPSGWQYRPTSRADVLTELDEQGDGLYEALRVLKVSEAALWKWCKENGMSATYRRLVIRSNPDRGQNQYTREAS